MKGSLNMAKPPGRLVILIYLIKILTTQQMNFLLENLLARVKQTEFFSIQCLELLIRTIFYIALNLPVDLNQGPMLLESHIELM